MRNFFNFHFSLLTKPLKLPKNNNSLNFNFQSSFSTIKPSIFNICLALIKGMYLSSQFTILLFFFKKLSFMNGENSDVEENNNGENSDLEERK